MSETTKEPSEVIQELDAKCAKLRKALIGLVGATEPKELDAMEAVIRMSKGVCEEDRANTLNAIHAIRDTA